MRNRWLWLLSGTALAFSLLSTGYLCLTSPSPQTAEVSAHMTLSPPVQKAEITLNTSGGSCMVKSIEGEICVIQDGVIQNTGLSASLLPTQDQQALTEGIPVEDAEALAALLEDLGS